MFVPSTVPLLYNLCSLVTNHVTKRALSLKIIRQIDHGAQNNTGYILQLPKMVILVPDDSLIHFAVSKNNTYRIKRVISMRDELKSLKSVYR